MGTDNTAKDFAPITRYDADSDSIVIVDEAEFWAVEKNEELGQPFSGVTFSLEDGTDLTISDEQLAALGYTKA